MGPFFRPPSVLLHPKAITNGQLGALSLFRSPPPSQYKSGGGRIVWHANARREEKTQKLTIVRTLHCLIACVIIEKGNNKMSYHVYLFQVMPQKLCL